MGIGGDGDRLVTLGRVTGAQGLQGWLKVHSDTMPRENIGSYPRLLLRQKGAWQSWKVSAVRRQGKQVLLKLKGCNGREQAEALIGADLAVYREQLPELNDPDDFYWTDLEGLQVETLDGITLGRVDHLFETGANDVMVVSGERERLVPFIWEQVIRKVDLKQALILVDWDPDF